MSDIVWTNEKRKLCDLKPYEHNPREIHQDSAKRLEESLEEFGQIQTLAIEPDNTLVDGHQREKVWKMSRRFGPDYEVDVRVASRELTEKERQKLVVFLHAGTIGQWDLDKIANTFEFEDLKDWGFPEGLLPEGWGEEDAVEDPGAQVDKAAELQEKWQVQRGQVWQVGRHRVMCGDSWNADDVLVLMEGELARAEIHDPPYGQAWLSNRYGPNQSAPNPQGVIVGDEDPCPELLEHWVSVLDDGAAIYVCTRWVQCETWRNWIAERLKVKNIIIWKKNNWSAGDLEGAYAFQYEQVIFASMPGHKLRGDRLPDVWEFDRVPPTDHPTQKPVGLYERCIEKSTDAGDIVADGFVGSGTFFVASERVGRIGYGMEISEKYVAVTLERLTDMGLDAELLT